MTIQPWWCCCDGEVPCEDQTLCDEIRRRIQEDPNLTPSERDDILDEIDRLCSGDFTGVDSVGINIVDRDLKFACPCVSVVSRVERRQRTSSYALVINYDDGTPQLVAVGGGILIEDFNCADGSLTSSVYTDRTIGTNVNCTSPSPLVSTLSDPLTCSDSGQEYKEVRFSCNNAASCPCSSLSTIPSGTYDPCFDEVESPAAASAMSEGPGGRLGQIMRGEP